jgi:hypothetical protein
MSFIEYDQLRFFDYVDGIHLNTVGVSIMVKCIKRVVNSKLGVLTNTNGDDRKGTNTERYRSSGSLFSNSFDPTWNMMCFVDTLPYFMSCVAP